MKTYSCFKYFVFISCLNLIEGTLSFRCDYVFNSACGGWFKHVIVPATWHDARLRCSLEGAVLASPTTLQMKAEMTKMINSTENEQQYEIFTGIHATFSQGDYYSVEGIPLSKIPQTWASNEPDNKDNKERCLTMNYNGDLADVTCEEIRPYICYRPEKPQKEVNECGTTDPEYRLDKRTNKCYKFHPVPRIFSRAFMACSAEGSHLAIINSDTEVRVLVDLFAKYPARTLVGMPFKDVAFIGIHDWDEHGDWRTIHGQTLAEAGYGKFSNGNPNNAYPGQYCGAMYRSGELDDMFCDKLAAFICEKEPCLDCMCF